MLSIEECDKHEIAFKKVPLFGSECLKDKKRLHFISGDLPACFESGHKKTCWIKVAFFLWPVGIWMRGSHFKSKHSKKCFSTISCTFVLNISAADLSFVVVVHPVNLPKWTDGQRKSFSVTYRKKKKRGKQMLMVIWTKNKVDWMLSSLAKGLSI